MSLPRLRLERCADLGGGMWKVDEGQARHLLRVLRIPPRGEVEGLIAGKRWRMALEISGEGLFARTLYQVPEAGHPPRIVLLASLLKGNDFELLLRGVTEIGVSTIVPIAASRSVPRYSGPEAGKKLLRWKRILEESTRQCGAPVIPEITAPVPLEKAVEVGLPPYRIAGFLGERAMPVGSFPPRPEATVAIGPEGDWDDREKQVLLEAGFCPVRLGPFVMKAVTAAIVACSYLVLAWEANVIGKNRGEEVSDPGPGMQDEPV
ncbi:MAG: 16S rRNA (uracil(1498)-N(3))-methyltransferase [Synergistaceae bacterium]|nr:16S rRNA (uracil(1498)-N(3))-methyltransferase [Synergistaceae bacterium]